jgi:TatA/E family protein of Tat protein translocase
MNFMGIGPQEMMIIAVIALLVFGPGKLPEVMGQAGKLVRDFRRMSSELSGEFEKTIAEAKDMTSGLTAELGGMTKEVNSVTNSVKKDLGLKGSAASNKAKSSSKTGTASKPGASSKTGSSTTTKVGGKSSTTTSTSSTTAAKSTAAKKPATPVASREDPSADVSLFEPAVVERPQRARKAVPSIISDPTPRASSVADHGSPIVPDDELLEAVSGTPSNDALSRARERRRNAGYARPSV